MRYDVKANLPWREYENAVEQTQEHVIPRLLGALESNGRSVKPALIHGNLWEGQCGTSLETGDIKIFDAGAYYGHSEAEIGIWQSENVRFGAKTYMRRWLVSLRIVIAFTAFLITSPILYISQARMSERSRLKRRSSGSRNLIADHI